MTDPAQTPTTRRTTWDKMTDAITSSPTAAAAVAIAAIAAVSAVVVVAILFGGAG